MNRYQRQQELIGKEGQNCLTQAKILCVGAGGLGSLVSSFLGAAGIGKITLVDDDIIEISNLSRQLTYCEADCGKSKVIILQEYLQALNSNTTICAINKRLNAQNITELIQQHDIVLDCSDNFKTRYLISDACYENDKPLISAAIDGFYGQVMTFLADVCYRCLFPYALSSRNCQNTGVIGPAVGIIASTQANQAFKLITGISYQSQIIQIDCLNNTSHTFKIVTNPNCRNNHDFQLSQYTKYIKHLNWIDAQKLQQNKTTQIVDLRMAKSSDRANYCKNKPVLFICHSGYKSQQQALHYAINGFMQVYYTQVNL